MIRHIDQLINMPSLDYPVGANMSAAEGFAAAVGNRIGVQLLIRDPSPVNVVGRGSSGMILAALTAKVLRKAGPRASVYHVPKPGEKVHHGERQFKDGFTPNAPIIIVDDFISSAATFEAIVRNLQQRTGHHRPHIFAVAVTEIQYPIDFKERVALLPCHIEHLIIKHNPDAASHLTASA